MRKTAKPFAKAEQLKKMKEKKEFYLFCGKGMSMFPCLRDGDQLLVKQVQPEEIDCGDIIVFDSGKGTKISHRVIKIENKNGGLWFKTKGDRYKNDDGIIAGDKILGKVVSIKRGARVLELSGKKWRTLLYKIECMFIAKLLFIKNLLKKFI